MGDAVFVSNISGADHTWTAGTVVGVSGQLCTVQLDDGLEFVRHRDHVRRRQSPMTDRGLNQADPVSAVPVPCRPVPPVAAVLAPSEPPPAALPPDVPVPVVPVPTVPPRIPPVRDPMETLAPGTPPLRQSQRFRRAPDRLQL